MPGRARENGSPPNDSFHRPESNVSFADASPLLEDPGRRAYLVEGPEVGSLVRRSTTLYSMSTQNSQDVLRWDDETERWVEEKQDSKALKYLKAFTGLAPQGIKAIAPMMPGKTAQNGVTTAATVGGLVHSVWDVTDLARDWNKLSTRDRFIKAGTIVAVASARGASIAATWLPEGGTARTIVERVGGIIEFGGSVFGTMKDFSKKPEKPKTEDSRKPERSDLETGLYHHENRQIESNDPAPEQTPDAASEYSSRHSSRKSTLSERDNPIGNRHDPGSPGAEGNLAHSMPDLRSASNKPQPLLRRRTLRSQVAFERDQAAKAASMVSPSSAAASGSNAATSRYYHGGSSDLKSKRGIR